MTASIVLGARFSPRQSSALKIRLRRGDLGVQALGAVAEQSRKAGPHIAVTTELTSNTLLIRLELSDV